MSRKRARINFLSLLLISRLLFILNLSLLVVSAQAKADDKQCDVKDNHCSGGKCESNSTCIGPYFGYHCLYYNAFGKKAAVIHKLVDMEIITVTFPLGKSKEIHFITTLDGSYYDFSKVVFSFKLTAEDKAVTCHGSVRESSWTYFIYTCNETMEFRIVVISNLKKEKIRKVDKTEAGVFLDSFFNTNRDRLKRARDTDVTIVQFPLSRVRCIQINLTRNITLQELPTITLKNTTDGVEYTCSGTSVQISPKYIEYQCSKLLKASFVVIRQINASLIQTVAITEGRNILSRQSYLQRMENSEQNRRVTCKSGKIIHEANAITTFKEPVMINSFIYLDKNDDAMNVTKVSITTYDVDCNIIWGHQSMEKDHKFYNDKETVAVKYLSLNEDNATRESACQLLVLGDCLSGSYGSDCSYTCSKKCLDGKCTVEGFCIGCKDNMTIGPQCCSKYCKDGVCKEDGSCIRGCKPGHEGINCTKGSVVLPCMCPTGHCDANGECNKSEKCTKGYFGPSCQYVDGTTTESSNQNDVLLDKDDRTCVNTNKDPLMIKTHPLRISFVRLVYTGSINFKDIDILFINEYNITETCLGKDVVISENIMEHHCQRTFDIIGVVITSSSVVRICDVFVSMGRRIAFDDSGHKNDTKTTDKGQFQGGKCSLTAVDDNNVYITLHHASPVSIDKFYLRHITDPSILQSKELIIYMIFGNINMKCTTSKKIADMYEVSQCTKAKETASTLTNGQNTESQKCTIEAYGACEIGKFGFQCEHNCSEVCKDWKCTLEGYCVGCNNKSFTGIRCNEPLPEVKECPAGTYGDHCDQQCNEKCKDNICTSHGHCISCKSDLQYGVNCEEKMIEKEEIPENSCPSNTYGDNCENYCSDSCKKCTETGLCDGCMSEYYQGPDCSILTAVCSPYCAGNGSCYADFECVSGCQPGYHGPQCTQLGLASKNNETQKMWTCHCENFDCSQPMDRCPLFSTCIKGWFGDSCDYRDLTVFADIANPLLTDNDNKTCFLAPDNVVIVQWLHQIPFSWLWITFEDSANVSNFSMTISYYNKFTIYFQEPNLYVKAIKSNFIQMSIDYQRWGNAIAVSWNGTGQVCTLSVSGGQNLALGLPTVPSSEKNQTLNDNIRLLTNGDFNSSNCVSGEYLNEFGLELSFPHPVIISTIEIFPDYRMPEMDRVTIEMWNRTSHVVEIGHRSNNTIEHPNLTRIPFAAAEYITRIRFSLVEGKKNICEIQIFGDCMPPRHGFFCSQECSKNSKDSFWFFGGTCSKSEQSSTQGPYSTTGEVQTNTTEKEITTRRTAPSNGVQIIKGLLLVNMGIMIITNIRL